MKRRHDFSCNGKGSIPKKYGNFDWDQVQNSFHRSKIQLQKKKSGVKNGWKLVQLRGGDPTLNGKFH